LNLNLQDKIREDPLNPRHPRSIMLNKNEGGIAPAFVFFCNCKIS